MITQTTRTKVLACTLITINFAAFGQNLEVASGGLLYLSPGAVVTAGGNFSNAGTVTLDASTTAYSQLKISGTVTGDVVQSQYLEAGSHLVSSPVSQGFTTTSGDKAKLYSYDAAAGNWATIGANFATAGLGFGAGGRLADSVFNGCSQCQCHGHSEHVDDPHLGLFWFQFT